MKIYPRRLTPFLLKEIKLPRIVVLTGMRQVGKTTLMGQIFNKIKTPNRIFLDLGNPLNQKIFEEENFDNIISNLEYAGLPSVEKSFIFLDAGRKIIYELFPLDFEEFLVFKEKEKKSVPEFSLKAKKKNKISFEIYKKFFEEYLEFGGFPAVVLEKKKERKRQVLEDVFKSYFEKEIKTLADFRELAKIRDLILLLTKRVGSKIEISKISFELGISRERVYSYLNFLEKRYFIFLISPFSQGANTEVRGARKVYFCDTGLLNYLT